MKLYPLPLGRLKLAMMYFILIAFTLPVYPIMMANMGIFVKIAFKLGLMLSFIFIGVKLHYISKSSIQHVFGKIKGTAINWIGV